MKYILPILFFVSSLFYFATPLPLAFAQTPSPGLSVVAAENLDNKWVIDSEVTSIGKNASRSGLLLDWMLRDYNWSYTNPGTANPLLPFWITLRNFVYVFIVALVVVAAIVMLVTRGRSLTIRRFFPRFLIIVALVTFSFSAVQVLYELVDIFQGFFVRPGGVPISQRDLLFIGWNYQPFVGLRLLGDANFEAAFTTLTFVKLTTFTYYVMVGILLVRKVILWFFIIISPLFPLLLLFYPLRNTAKIWLGEFFRWLLYAPLFGIFLAGLVSLWKIGIPLSFNFGGVNSTSSIIFPTAVSILLGGPGQAVGQLNNLNVVDTYAQYIVALLMLWGVIILPWVLLQIFLDYFENLNVQNSSFFKTFSSYINKVPIIPPPGTPPPPPEPEEGGTGRARSIPLIKEFQVPSVTGLAKPIPISAPVNVSQMTKITVPKLVDIARFESEAISNSEKVREEAQRVSETLIKIANPEKLTTQIERSEFERMRETLQNQSQKGDNVATSILNAANAYSQSSKSVSDQTTNVTHILNLLANPQTVHDEKERERFISLRERIQTEVKSGNPLAEAVLRSSTAASTQNITQIIQELANPVVNKETYEKTEKLRERIEKESKEGNSLATTILHTIQSLKQQMVSSTSITDLLSPSRVSDTAVRQKLTSLRETLEKEKGQGNPYASDMLSRVEKLSQATSQEERDTLIRELRESLISEEHSGNPLASQILSVLKEVDTSERIREGIINLSQPSIIRDSLEKERIEKVKEFITREREKGNTIAKELSTHLEKLSQTTNSSEEGKLITIIKESLIKESESKNPLASTILSVLGQVQEAKNISESIRFLATPSLVSDAKAREIYVKLQDSIVSEKEKGSEFARALIEKFDKVTQETNVQEKEKIVSEISESILKEKDRGNPLAELILNQVKDISQTSTQTSITNLSTQLQQARKEGNSLATEILSLAEKKELTEEEAKHLERKVEIAKQNGEPLGVLLSELLTRRREALEKEAPLKAALPVTNRIQQVSLDDYEAVKKMWTENYENLERPGVEGMAGRKAWIKDDIHQISQTIDLLASEDQEKVTEGMERVSDILPFLLIGGFSQAEITAYMKAKLEAAKGVLSQIEKKESAEDTEVVVERKKTTEPKRMTVTTQAQVPSSTSVDVEGANAPSVSSSVTRLVTPSQTPAQTSEFLLRLANITIPTLRSVATYDKMLLSKQEEQNQDIRLMRETLAGIASPDTASSPEKREYYTTIREKLLKEQEAGNASAASVLAGAEAISAKKVMKEIEQYSAVASLVTLLQEGQKTDGLSLEEITQLKERISFEASRGNEFARNLEKSMTDPTVLKDELQKTALITQTQEAYHDGDTLAQTIVNLSQSVKTSEAQAYKTSLNNAYHLLQMLTDTTYVTEADKTVASQIAQEVSEQAAKGDEVASKFLQMITQAKENGIDVQAIVQVQDFLSKNSNLLAPSLPSLSTYLSKQTQPREALSHVLSTITKPVKSAEEKGDVRKLHEEVIKTQDEPFVKKLLEWSRMLDKEQIDEIASVLKGIDNPTSLSEKDRVQELSALQSELEKQKDHSIFADAVLSLAHGVSLGEITQKDIQALVPTLMRRTFTEAMQGNKLALSLQNVIYEELQKEQDLSVLHRVLSALSDPTRLPRDQKDQIASLRTLVVTEKQQGNSLAGQITDIVSKIISKETSKNSNILQALWNEVVLQNKQGNKLAEAIVKEIEHQQQAERLFDLGEILKVLSQIDTLPENEREAYKSVLSSLENAASKGDASAMSMLSAIEITKKQGVDLSEVKKVADLLRSSSSSSYIQGLSVLVNTSILSQSALRELQEILVDIETNNARVEKLKTLFRENDNVFSQSILKAAQEISGNISYEKRQELLMKTRESILREEKNGNAVASEILHLLVQQKRMKNQELFLQTLEKMASPDSIQLPEVKQQIDSVVSVMNSSPLNDPFAGVIKAVVSSLKNRTSEQDTQEILAVIKDFVQKEAESGNPLAIRILSQVPKDQSNLSEEKIRQEVDAESKKGNSLAKLLQSLIQKEKLESPGFVLPEENKLQQVSIEDYESVKRMWTEGYKKLDVPGLGRSREEWMADEVEHITQTISLLTSSNSAERNEGMQRVSHILPFLLIGGFTQAEVTSYLKAKLEAAKSVRDQLSEQNDESETQVATPSTKTTPAKLKKQEEVG